MIVDGTARRVRGRAWSRRSSPPCRAVAVGVGRTVASAASPARRRRRSRGEREPARRARRSMNRFMQHRIPPTLGGQVGHRPIGLRTALASRVWLSRTERSTGLVPDRVEGPPLRDSAGISPDFARTVQATTLHAGGRAPSSHARDDRTRAARADGRPASRRAALGTVARARQHRQRQGQELGGVRRDAACAGASTGRSPWCSS